MSMEPVACESFANSVCNQNISKIWNQFQIPNQPTIQSFVFYLYSPKIHTISQDRRIKQIEDSILLYINNAAIQKMQLSARLGGQIPVSKRLFNIPNESKLHQSLIYFRISNISK